MPRENHPSMRTHLDHGALWGPAGSATHDHRHWFLARGKPQYWTDTELNRPVAVIEALKQAGR